MYHRYIRVKYFSTGARTKKIQKIIGDDYFSAAKNEKCV